MVPSNIHKYTIRHESDPAGSDYELPIYPDRVKAGISDVNRWSYRNIKGFYKNQLAVRQGKLFWTFSLYPQDKSIELIKEHIYDKVDQYKTDHFYINAYVSGYGWVSGLFYLMDTITVEDVGYSGNGNVVAPYVKFELHWIEVDGNIINDVGTPAS